MNWPYNKMSREIHDVYGPNGETIDCSSWTRVNWLEVVAAGENVEAQREILQRPQRFADCMRAGNYAETERMLAAGYSLPDIRVQHVDFPHVCYYPRTALYQLQHVALTAEIVEMLLPHFVAPNLEQCAAHLRAWRL